MDGFAKTITNLKPKLYNTKGIMNKTKIHNSKCLKCGAIHEEMIKIGAMVFCDNCYGYEFKNEQFFLPESELGVRYYEWLEVYKKQ